MDPAPPDAKRMRRWVPPGAARPHPHTQVLLPSSHQPLSPPSDAPHISSTQLPRPQGPSHHYHHHPAGVSPYQYPPRAAELSLPSPTPVSTYEYAQKHLDTDHRHLVQDTLAPMEDRYRQQPPPRHPGHTPASQIASTPRYLPPQHFPPQQSPKALQGHSQHQQQPLQPQYPQQYLQQHAPPPPPPAFQGDPSLPRNTNHESPSSMSSTPGAYRALGFPRGPPTPVAQQQPYEQAPYSQTQKPFYGDFQIGAKKKNTRASQACDQCRQLKAKCDELKPCSTCKEKGTECRYRDSLPIAADETQPGITEGISDLKSALQLMLSHFEALEARLARIEPAFSKLLQAFEEFTPTVVPQREFGVAAPLSSPNLSLPSPSSPVPLEEPTDAVTTTFCIGDCVEADLGPPVPPGELLLNWDPIKELIQHHLEREGIKYVSEYPIRLEQSRGVLRVFGRGEDCHQQNSTKATANHGNAEIGNNGLSDAVASSPAGDGDQSGTCLNSGGRIKCQRSVLGPDGNPDFSEQKITKYVESFKNNILNMHPIVYPRVLDEWVHQFINELSPANPKAKAQPLQSTCAVPQPQELTGAKRKRSPDPDVVPVMPSSQRLGKPSRSNNSALVLTVLALGKICLYQGEIPDTCFPVDPISQGITASRPGVPPLPKAQERGCKSGKPSIHDASGASLGAAVRAEYSLKKNYEVIPGLEYFALATDILGNNHGAYGNMKSVYANIFAGLYHGQLARPLESYAFIHEASHKLELLMRPSLDEMKNIKNSTKLIQEEKHNQLALAFWTCLQLESDLIAELPLSPSGLFQFENAMPQPNMSLLRAFDQRVVESYSAQLYLRTRLNNIQDANLVADGVSKTPWVPSSFRFNEADPPADDILSARLRAKYWEVRAVTYRRSIRQILQGSYKTRHNSQSPHTGVLTEYSQGANAPFIPPNLEKQSGLGRLIEEARKGIFALIENTRSFHGLGEKRPIITNVFGTAHAQWGNVLVLAAVYKDSVLQKFVPEELLRELFQKTIAFLRQSSTQTSSLRSDMRILEGLQCDLFPSDRKMASSFSNNNSHPAPKLLMSAPLLSDASIQPLREKQPLLAHLEM